MLAPPNFGCALISFERLPPTLKPLRASVSGVAGNDRDEQELERLSRLNQGFAELVPHNRALGLKFVGYGEGQAVIVLPYDDRFVGNPETGVLHGGAVSALMDATCGAAVIMKMHAATAIATLDIRIDYLRPAAPRKDVTCRAECYKLTKNVAFVRAIAFNDDESDPIASAAASFMIFEKGKTVGGERG